MRRKLLVLGLALAGVVGTLAFTGQPAACFGCSQRCFVSGASCGIDCVCGCRMTDCQCFAIYQQGPAEDAGYDFTRGR